jgi:hypothetical protein
MNSPGVYTLSAPITSAGTAVTSSIEDLDGMLACHLELSFVYGSGGTTCKAYAQFSLDGGSTWRDAACAAFTTASAIKPFAISRLTEKLSSPVAPTDGTLTDDTAVGSMLGPVWRLKVVTVGTYAGSTQVILRLNAA